MNISISFEQATNIPATCLAFIKILQTWRRVSRKPEAKYKAGVGGNVCNVECVHSDTEESMMEYWALIVGK